VQKLTKSDFKVPALLIALSVVPTLGGVIRFINLSGTGASAPEHARFAHAPGPIVVHVFCATLYCLLGAFQFSAALRARWPRMHRRAGKLLVLCGLAAGATGVWMTAAYRIPVDQQGPLLYGVRIAVGIAMIAAILIGWSSILRRDIARHEAFMIRAYALGQGAGTQVFVLGPWMLLTGESGGLTRDLLMTLAWLINVLVAEHLIKARPGARAAVGRQSHHLAAAGNRP
jgi:hypothetical protein